MGRADVEDGHEVNIFCYLFYIWDNKNSSILFHLSDQPKEVEDREAEEEGEEEPAQSEGGFGAARSMGRAVVVGADDNKDEGLGGEEIRIT